MTDLAERLNWNKMNGLIPAVVSDAESGQVLMLAYMNREALALTVSTGRVTFFSRTRQSAWVKGETSGHTLRLVDVTPDCDNDALLVRATPAGPTCHLGNTSCFSGAAPPLGFLAELAAVIAARAHAGAAESYTAKLLADGPRAVAQKIGEEATEVVVAALSETPDRLVEEAADLLFHLMVALHQKGVALTDVVAALERRHRRRL